jgi:hypothetical protein
MTMSAALHLGTTGIDFEALGRQAYLNDEHGAPALNAAVQAEPDVKQAEQAAARTTDQRTTVVVNLP